MAMLDVNQSRARQQRLLPAIAEQRLDAVVVGLTEHVYYLSAFRSFWLQQSALVIRADGRSFAVTANQPAKNIAADEVRAYVASSHGTQRQEQPANIAAHLLDYLKSSGCKTIGVDASPVASQLAMNDAIQCRPIDSFLWQLRRQKDADEIALMRIAHQCGDAMFAKAREIIRPGISEIEVFAKLHQAAVEQSGEPMTALLGNDYASGVGGGSPRGNKTAAAGQIYIIDVGPTYRGYFSDGARCYPVSGSATDAQHKAFGAVKSVFPIFEKMARPGARCRDIWDAVNEHLKSVASVGLAHHLGHGVGLQPHEYPHVNPAWEDVLLENEVVTCEPGIYDTALNAGFRLENVYLITPSGPENLLTFPMELN